MVIRNGKIAALDRAFTFHEAVAVKNGWIIAAGSGALVSGYIGPDTKIIDLQGRMLLPAAHDAHLHATLCGLTMKPGFLNLGSPEIRSVRDIQGKIAAIVKEKKPGDGYTETASLNFSLRNAPRKSAALTAGTWIRFRLTILSC
jgi:predicted amidohydrolase YtcJ